MKKSNQSKKQGISKQQHIIQSPKQEPKQVVNKVFRMNDNDFVAANNKEEAIEWYEKEKNVQVSKVVEMDIEQNGMFIKVSDVPQDKQNLIERKVNSNDVEKGLLKFKDVIEIHGKTNPYVIDTIQ